LKTPAFDLSGAEEARPSGEGFIHDMDLLFLDEPTIGLDPIMRRSILDLLKDKVERENLTILFTTHNLEEAIISATGSRSWTGANPRTRFC